MKTLTTTAIVALLTATIGLSAVAPTFAQQAAPATVEAAEPAAGLRFHHQNGPGRFGGGGFLGFGGGAEAVEIALVRLSHAVELTPEQQPLFDALKTAALDAATAFETATEDLRPDPAAAQTAERPDLSERLENRIAIETAHLAALEAVQPAFTAFFDSLTDEQKAALTPDRREGGRPGMMGKGDGPRHFERHHING